MKKQILELMQISDVSYYRWKKSPKQKDKKEAPKIFSLLEYTFTEEDLNEFLTTGKIAKQELIKNYDFKNLEQKLNEQNINQNRLNEIIKLFTIYDADTLKNALREALDKNNISFGTVEYFKQKRSKLEVIKKIENLLDDMHHEKQSSSRYISSIPNIENDEKNKSYYEFEKAVTYLNDKLGFDFSESDRVLVYNIISRYRVYNTLYDLDKISKD